MYVVTTQSLCVFLTHDIKIPTFWLSHPTDFTHQKDSSPKEGSTPRSHESSLKWNSMKGLLPGAATFLGDDFA